MTQSANVVHWRARTSPRLRRFALWVMGTIGALLVALYVSGYFLLWSMKIETRSTTPLTILRYAYFYADRPDIRQRIFLCSAVALALVTAGVVVVLKPRPRPLHGAAQFARRSEMARAGLFADNGLFLGRYGGRYLVLGGQQGAIVCAPPRADKGVAVVVPNLLSFLGSVICLDVKLENWRITAGFRERIGQACFKFNPLDESGDTACWNPLTYVSADPNLRINDVQRIAAILFPEVPGTDPFWVASGRSMFLGLTLYVLETPSLPSTLGEVLRQGMATDAEGFAAHWKRVIGGRQSGRYPLSAACVRALSDLMDLAPVTASSIRKTFTSRLDIFSNPLIDAATASNDFDLRDLRKCPMSVYIGINPGDLQLLRPLLNLFIEQALALQTRELPEQNPALKYQVLAMLDETAAAGRIPVLAQAISYLPGYNVRVFLVVQAYSQLRELYGLQNADTMVKSLAARIFYAPKDYSEANELSQELGVTTVKVKSFSKPAFNLADLHGHRSRTVNVSEQKRPLLLPQEIKELGRDREIILYEGLRPILCRKNRYFEDRLFRKRLFPPPARSAPAGIHRAIVRPVVPATSPAPVAPPAVPAFREISPEDMPFLESLTLEDFDIKVDAIPVAEGNPPSDAQLQVAVDAFLSQLRAA